MGKIILLSEFEIRCRNEIIDDSYPSGHLIQENALLAETASHLEVIMFGIVSDTEFESLIADKVTSAKVVDIQRGRGNKIEVPIELKKVIAEEAIAGTPAKKLSELFNVSESSISAYKHDTTSTTTYNQPNEELKKSNNKVREVIIDSARDRLSKAIECITDEKLEGAEARDAAGIAKDMSVVIKNLEPEVNRGNGQLNQQFIFYAPKTRKESDFEFLEER